MAAMIDQGAAEFLGFLVVAVALPVVASLRFTRGCRDGLSAGFVTGVAILILGTGLGGLYGVGLKAVLDRPEMNWSRLWLLGAMFGGVSGAAIGKMRARHRRPK